MRILKNPIFWVAILVIAAAAFFLIPRGPDGRGQNGPVAAQTETVRVGYLRLLSGVPLYTAVREGYFAEEGLNVELRVIKSGPEGNEALAAGNLDVAFSIVPSLVVARAQGVPNDLVSIFGASVDGPDVRDHRIMVRAGSSISTAKDLVGKKVAVVGWPGRTSDVLELLDYFERKGISQKSVTLVGMGHGDMTAALESGVIDAAAAAEPYIGMGEQAGKVKTLSGDDAFYYPLDGETEVTTYLARKSWIDANPKVATRFLRALEKGRQKAEDLDWLVNKGLPTFNSNTRPAIDFVVITAAQAKGLHFSPIKREVSLGGLGHVTGQLLRHGPIKKAPDDLGSLILPFKNGSGATPAQR